MTLAPRSLAIVGIMALALVAAPAARAGIQMYHGAWIAQSFGNDVTNGAGGQTESDQFEFLGVPLGNNCNALFPACTFSQTGASASTPPPTTPLTAKQFDPLAAFCVPLTAWGLGPTRPAKGATPQTAKGRPIPPRYRNPAHFTPGGNGKTTACSDASTILGGQATMTVLTTNDTRRGVGMRGAPVSGFNTLYTTTGSDPRAFSFYAAPATPTAPTYAGMRRTTTGSFSNFAPYLYSYTYATLRNSAGIFNKGGGFFSTGAGTSTVSFPYKKGGGTAANSVVKKGANSFGGTMRLLGSMTNKVCYFRNGGCSLGQHNWRYDQVGITAAGKAGGVVTAPAIVTYSAVYYHTLLMQASTVMAVGSRFPWTTGTVTVTATGRGPNNTIEQRAGYDNRVGSARGTVQLVTPIITKWLQPSVNFETGGIGVLRVRFLPEPTTWMTLVAGISLLGVLYRVRGR